MRSVTVARRFSAIVALAAIAGALAVLVAALIRHLPVLLAATLCLSVAVGAAAYAVTRTGGRRLAAAVLAALALVAPIVLVVIYGGLLKLLLLLALQAVAGVATRHALGRDIHALKSGPTPGAAVPPAARPVLLPVAIVPPLLRRLKRRGRRARTIIDVAPLIRLIALLRAGWFGFPTA
jgi:hypothetical protein